jgi:hypothetical protein
LRVFGHDGYSIQYRVYPEARAKMLSPTSEAWEEEQQDTDTWSIRAAPILKKIRILRVADMPHRFITTGVSTGDHLFIFDGLFCSENSKAMSELMDLMANGHTDDGAETAIQLWSASDGPGINRVHYYYPSREKAEKRMEDFLQNALAVLQNTPRKGADSGAFGKEAILISINKDKRSLYASHLYLNEASVLELSCPCLRNVLAGRSIDDARNQN